MNKLEQAARQALHLMKHIGIDHVGLREALSEPKCWCETCRPITMDDMRMVLCPTCGNKRCPHATDHRNACTGSNKPGQKGSSYEHCKPAEQAEQEPVHESLQIAAVALQDIACSSQTNNLLWWQIRAREAQKQIAERLTNSAPAEPVKQEPVAIDGLARACNLAGIDYKDFLRIKAYLPIAAPVRQAEQEPVGYWQGKFSQDGGAVLYEVPQASAFGYHYPNHPVYAAPVRTKDLTDDEIWKELTAIQASSIKRSWLSFARAVIAKYREKNK